MAYRNPVQFLKKDDAGEWKPVASCRAKISGIGGAEYWAAAAQQATTVKIFRVPYHTTLAELIPQTTRILFAGTPYDVKTIDDFEERHIELAFKTEAHYGR